MPRPRFSLRLLLAVVALIAVGFGSCMITSGDKLRVAQDLVADFTKYDEPTADNLANSGKTVGDAEPSYFVICDFLPADAPISTNPHVHRIKNSEHDAMFKSHQFKNTSYLKLELKESTPFSMTFEVSRVAGPLMGYGERLSVRKILFYLRLKKTPLWIS